MSTQSAEQTTTFEQTCINTIRFLAVDAVQQANSGHPGMPMGMAPVAHVLWTRHLRYDPADPGWPDRDRFVLSAGHGSMLLYAMLHLTGYDLTIDDLRAFRQLDSRTPGHPERGWTPGVETTTGPLGQGFGNAVGMAMAEAYLAATFNGHGHTVVDHRTFVIASDGDMMEGISHEAASLAGHLDLGKLIVVYDDNHISIEGGTELAFGDDVVERFDAYGWHTQRVADANDTAAIDEALTVAERVSDRPSLIDVRSHIGYGSPNKQDTAKAHGEALGPDEVTLTKEALGWPLEPAFHVPDEVSDFYRAAGARGIELRAQWIARLEAWRSDDPALAETWERAWHHQPEPGWDEQLPAFAPDDGATATRSASGAALNAIAPYLPTLIGGSADLAPSNNTLLKKYGDFEKGDYGQRNLHFGVREHAMASASNGMAVHGGVRPYAGTFFVFTDYMRPALRLGAIMDAPVIYVLTHDSIGLGEDGPTHQPIEHPAMMRATPNWTIVRPADATETVEAWRLAIEHTSGPIGLVLTRQKLPVIDRDKYAPASGVRRGGYVLAESAPGELPELILIATGSEVSLALDAFERLRDEGVRARVVSLPSREVFAAQEQAYRDGVLPPQVTARLSVEAATPFGWREIVGDQGDIMGLDHFGGSAPYTGLFEKFGLTAENVYLRARALLERTS